MIKKIDHIGIAVNNIEKSLALYGEILELELQEIELVEEQKVRTAFLPVNDIILELLETTDPDGPVGKFIRERGPGIHHIAFEVDDIEATMARMKKAGIRLIDPFPKDGARGAKIAFIHPYDANGVLIEICER